MLFINSCSLKKHFLLQNYISTSNLNLLQKSVSVKTIIVKYKKYATVILFFKFKEKVNYIPKSYLTGFKPKK